MLGPVESEGAGGTRGVEEAGEEGSVAVTTGAVDTGIWGYPVCTARGG